MKAFLDVFLPSMRVCKLRRQRWNGIHFSPCHLPLSLEMDGVREAGLSPSNHSQPPAQPRARDNPSSAPRGKQEGRIRFDGFVLQVLLSFPNPLSKRSWIFRQGEAWAGSVRKTRLGLFLSFFFFFNN
uniref:Uncharacterized protein n=1 Tax=Rousettus aegyptiacus TaxID=9407 RepID=A0A7J8H2K2_ROUAE|nr:hypothetical protein HJG63_011382 [Rousettus aegyptiacus]